MVVITKVTEISPGVHRNTTSTQWVYIILLMILCSCENVTGAIPNLTRICTGIDIVLTSYEILVALRCTTYTRGLGCAEQ